MGLLNNTVLHSGINELSSCKEFSITEFISCDSIWEEKDSIAAASAIKGRLVGVDFIPAKDRPYILEVNATPGLSGIEEVHNGLVVEILNHFKNRENWSWLFGQ